MPNTTQPSGKQHNIATLLDIARVPADRVPALLAELPRLLDEIRPLLSVIDRLSPEEVELVAKELAWLDDGITDGSADEKQITIEFGKKKV